jgi:GNAT superfamily N-acetyltransferase
MLDRLFANPRADAVVAEQGGRVVGFLFGERMDLPPLDLVSLFIPPHSIALPIEGHAVAAGTDPTVAYRAMYAMLARRWVEEGYFVHRVAIVPGSPEVQEAWVALGFGRHLTAATRPTTLPVSGPMASTPDIRAVSPEEIDDVMELAAALNDHHWQSPMFWPHLHETEPAAREYNLNALRSGSEPYFVGYQDGVPVAMQTFLKPGFTPPIVAGARDVYLFEGVTIEAARGSGLGGALLRHAMEWARSTGLETCTLHFASGNPSGAPFWLGHGFEPVEFGMERRIDPRVAWARPRS